MTDETTQPEPASDPDSELVDGLFPREWAFCREYVIDHKGVQAAIRAGYGKAGANVRRCELMARPRVQAEIARLEAEAIKRAEIKVDDVLRELKVLGFSNIRDVLSFGPGGVVLKDSDTLSAEVMATVAEASQTISKDGGRISAKMHDKLKGLELLGRYLKMWTDKVEVSTAESPIPLSVLEQLPEEVLMMLAGLAPPQLPAENMEPERLEEEGDE